MKCFDCTSTASSGWSVERSRTVLDKYVKNHNNVGGPVDHAGREQPLRSRITTAFA